MKRVSIPDAKTNLSRYLRSLRKKVRKPRIGAAKGKLVVPDSFFDPLPDGVLKAFAGN